MLSLPPDVLRIIFAYCGTLEHAMLTLVCWYLRRNSKSLGIAVADYVYLIATEFAATSGYLELLQWLVKRGCRLTKNTAIAAVKADQVEVFDWISTKIKYNNSVQNQIIVQVSEHSSLKIIQWLYKKGNSSDRKIFRDKMNVMLNKIIENAIFKKRLDVIKYCKKTFKDQNVITRAHEVYIIRARHIPTIVWHVRAINSYSILNTFIEAGDRAVFDHIIKYKPDIKFDPMLYRTAIVYGRLNIIRLLRFHGTPLYFQFVKTANNYRWSDILDYIAEHNIIDPPEKNPNHDLDQDSD
jgi:hypothetical protein